MDRLIYTAMAGAKHLMEKQASNSNNLANVSTTGFRAQIDAFRAVPVQGDGLPTRAFVVDVTSGSDFTPGTLQQTGRSLDMAVRGAGWIAVQAADGSEAYTRGGALKLSENGELQNEAGLKVLGDAGAISIPPEAHVAIASDGTLTAHTSDGGSAASVTLGRIKLVNPPPASLVRGDDGLFRMKAGGNAEADAKVSVLGAALEGSNVNVVDAMVSMIGIARQFELQMGMLKNAESNAAKADQILALN
jgi:flagellar basal-body rod protein FlgF